MIKKYIIAHDLGTSSNKAILTTMDGEIVAQEKHAYPLYHPEARQAEQDAYDWLNSVCDTTKQLLKKKRISADKIACMTFCTQTQCLVPVDKQGTPLRRAFSWLDSRSADILRKKIWTSPRLMGYNPYWLIRFLSISGGAPGHSGKDQIGKLLWMQENEPDIYRDAYKFIDAKDFVIKQLTDRFVTSVDLAYLWWLLDTRKKKYEWHKGLCHKAEVEIDRLCEVRESGAIVGDLTEAGAKLCGLKAGTPVINGAGDIAAAALGAGAIEENDKTMYMGTSAWVGSHVTKRKADVPHYVGCIGSALSSEYYLAMAHQQTAGACLEWLKTQLFPDFKGSDADFFPLLNEDIKKIPPGSNGLMFTPWMFGERCPVHDEHARAGFYNLNLGHSRSHMARAMIEGITMNINWALETVENLFKASEHVRIIGGGASSDLWCQLIADMTGKVIQRMSDYSHAGAKGMALLSSHALGHLPSIQAIRDQIQIEKEFHPETGTHQMYRKLYKEFKNIYSQNRAWFKRMHAIIQ